VEVSGCHRKMCMAASSGPAGQRQVSGRSAAGQRQVTAGQRQVIGRSLAGQRRVNFTGILVIRRYFLGLGSMVEEGGRALNTQARHPCTNCMDVMLSHLLLAYLKTSKQD
jgi:hypothetical protein